MGIGTGEIRNLFCCVIVFLRALNVAVKSDRPALFPILRVVFINSRAMPQKAVKLSSPGIHHYSDVATPNHQIARLRLFHSSKIIGSAIKIGRTRIWIREPRLLIYGMHQV